MNIYRSTKAMPYVYQCVNRNTGEFYFGYREANISPSSEDFPKYRTSSPKVRPIFDQFDWVILAEFLDAESAFRFEQFLIFEHWKDPLLLNRNCRHGAKAAFRCKHENRIYGPLSEEWKKKVSDGLTGIVRSAETRKKMSDSMKGKPHLWAVGDGNNMKLPGVAERHKAGCIARSAIKGECPHCGRLFSRNTYARYHGDKCKNRPT